MLRLKKAGEIFNRARNKIKCFWTSFVCWINHLIKHNFGRSKEWNYWVGLKLIVQNKSTKSERKQLKLFFIIPNKNFFCWSFSHSVQIDEKEEKETCEMSMTQFAASLCHLFFFSSSCCATTSDHFDRQKMYHIYATFLRLQQKSLTRSCD